MASFILTGTDTGIGKTTVAAMLLLALDWIYWKPIQSGTEDGTDTQTVQALTGLPSNRFWPERYVLSQPLSPHRAAALDGVTITPFLPPETEKPLLIEGAGGLMLPITPDLLQIDLFRTWKRLFFCALGRGWGRSITRFCLSRRSAPETCRFRGLFSWVQSIQTRFKPSRTFRGHGFWGAYRIWNPLMPQPYSAFSFSIFSRRISADRGYSFWANWSKARSASAAYISEGPPPI